jgi:uncharacterized protein YkwD
MRFCGRMAFVPALVGSVFLSSAAHAARLDDAVLDELNFARTRPADYARELRQQIMAPRRDRYDSGSGDEAADVEEAIDFLERQAPLPPLAPDTRIEAAARDHARTQGPSGAVGHGPAGALGARLREHGVWAGLSAENISYGQDDPRDVVRQLIVDSGVASRGHRRNIFAASYTLAGVACGPHRAYGVMCVIDFAGALAPR